MSFPPAVTLLTSFKKKSVDLFLNLKYTQAKYDELH